MARKTQPLDVHQPWKDPEPHQEGAPVSQRHEQQEVAQGATPEPVLNGIQGGDGNGSVQEQPKKYQPWKSWKAPWKKLEALEAIEKFTFCLVVFTIVSSTADVYQSYLMRETFVATQRAAVYLGLPDGKFAELLPGKSSLRIALYFRNYGASVAHYVNVDIRPITSQPDPYVVLPFPK